METTGPKTSSVSTRAPAGTPVRTVGQWNAPSRLPPVLTVAPASTASPTQASTRSAAASSTKGPMSVPGSLLLPTTSRSAPATTRSTKLVGNLGCGEHALDGQAVLAGGAERAVDDGVGGTLDVGIGQDDDGTVATELHQRLLGAGRTGDRVARGVPAGERHHVDQRVAHECSPHGGTAAGEHREPTSRHSGLEQEVDEGERGQRRLLGGLEHDAVPADQCGAQLVRHQVERVVEGRDRADDADRFTRVPADAAPATRGVAEGEGAHPRGDGPARPTGERSRRLSAPLGRRRARACSLRGRSGLRRARDVPSGEPPPGSSLTALPDRPVVPSRTERETARTAASTSAAEQSETVPTTVPSSGRERRGGGRWAPRAGPEGPARRGPVPCRAARS